MAKEIDWEDDSIKPSGKTDFAERKFDLEAGREDQIKIISNPVVFKRHWIAEKRRYATCTEAEDCPVCKMGYEPAEVFACTIVHIASKKGKNVQKIGLTKVWVFGDAGKYEQIKQMKREYAPDGDLKKLEIRITCTDTGFQKIGGMYPVVDVSKKLMDKSMVEDVKENKDLLQKFIKPRSAADTEKMLDDADAEEPAVAEDVLEDEETEEVVKPAPKAVVKPGAKPLAKPVAKKPVVQEESTEDSDIDSEIEAMLQ